MASAKAWFATPQDALTAIRELFDDADVDRQGSLTASEIVGAVHHFYRVTEGADVSSYRVESEVLVCDTSALCFVLSVSPFYQVAVACEAVDANHDGRIQFGEFVQMFARGAPFRFRSIDRSVMTEVSHALREPIGPAAATNLKPSCD